MRVARPVRGRLTRVIPNQKRGPTGRCPVPDRVLEWSNTWVLSHLHGAVRKTGDGEIPRSGCPRNAGGLNVAVMARKQVGLC